MVFIARHIISIVESSSQKTWKLKDTFRKPPTCPQPKTPQPPTMYPHEKNPERKQKKRTRLGEVFGHRSWPQIERERFLVKARTPYLKIKDC